MFVYPYLACNTFEAQNRFQKEVIEDKDSCIFLKTTMSLGRS